MNVGTLTAILTLKDVFSGRLSAPTRALATFAAEAGAAGLVLQRFADATEMAVQKGTEYQRTLAKIEALTNATVETTEQWSDSILRLGPAVGRSPQDLADAMYFVASSGQFAAESFEILEVAAQASATGMGRTADVARLLTSVMNAYRQTTMTAAEAGDILTQTIVEGNVEANELVGTLGRVTGVAAAFGISFQEVGAYVATFTRVIPSAHQAVTALRQLILNLEAPSREASKALATIGLTANDVRFAIKEQGLNATLAELIQMTEGNVEMLDAFVPRIRALGGLMSVAVSQGDTYADSLHRIQTAQKRLAEATEKMQRTASYQLLRLEAAWDSLYTKIGQVIEPLRARIVEFSADLVAAFATVSFEDLWSNGTGDPLTRMGAALGLAFRRVREEQEKMVDTTTIINSQTWETAAAYEALGMSADGVVEAHGWMLHGFQQLPGVLDNSEKHAREFLNTLSEIVGADAQDQLASLWEIWSKLTPAQRNNTNIMRALADQYSKFRDQLQQTSPHFEAMLAHFVRMDASTKEHTRQVMAAEEQLLSMWEKEEKAVEDLHDAMVRRAEDEQLKNWMDNIPKQLEEMEAELRKMALASRMREAEQALADFDRELEESEARAKAARKQYKDLADTFNDIADVFQIMGRALRRFGLDADSTFRRVVTGLEDTAEGIATAFAGAAGGGPVMLIGGIVQGLTGLAQVFGMFDDSAAEARRQVWAARESWIDAQGGIDALIQRARWLHVSLTEAFTAQTVEDFTAAVREAEQQMDFMEGAWERLQEAIERYGFTLEELPDALQQERLSGMFTQLWTDLQLLIGAGFDLETVLRRMAPAINEMVIAAMTAGIAIPESFRPFIQQLIDMGLLVDEFGVRIESIDDLDISWAPDLETVLADVAGAVRDLVDAIRLILGLPELYVDADVNVYQGPPPHDPDQHQIPAQHGFAGWAMQETQFTVGENAPEFVTVTPEAQMRAKGGGGGDSMVFHFYIQQPDGSWFRAVERATKQRRVRIHPNAVRAF